ncbi:MAG: peptidyl-prolyl cis-trans isomerase [Qipengyuania vulgaris]
MMRKFLRDPLAHFLIAGAAIWGVFSLTGGEVDPEARTINLSREQQAGLALAFERTMGRAPTDAELDARIAQWVREEVLYREALRLGLDEGDPVVKRRLATKMDELASAQAELAQPSQGELQVWYREHASAYEAGSLLDFEQAYFPTRDAAVAAGGEARPRGEPISLPRNVQGMSGREVGQLFGSEFADRLSRLEASSEWQGPVQSGYGWHLVRVTRRDAGRVPLFEEVRDKVERDWRSRTIAARRDKAYQVLRDAYAIEVE